MFDLNEVTSVVIVVKMDEILHQEIFVARVVCVLIYDDKKFHRVIKFRYSRKGSHPLK